MTTTDTAHRRLCQTLFDALEHGDRAAVERCYADDCVLWFDGTGTETGKTENLEVLRAVAGLHRRRTYDDRQIHTFHDGFVVLYVLNRNGAAAATCEAAGGPIPLPVTQLLPGIRIAMVEDPEGNALEFLEQKKPG